METRIFSCTNLPRYKKLEDLLEKSFSLVKMPSLQPVVMCVMKHLPKVRAVEPALPGKVREPVLTYYCLASLPHALGWWRSDWQLGAGSCLAPGKFYELNLQQALSTFFSESQTSSA